MEKKSVIFDLDGTLADISVRRDFCRKENGKLNWGKFYDPINIHMDIPCESVITAYKAHKDAGHRMVIFSGRSEQTLEATINWLHTYGIHFDKLRMRPNIKGSFPGIDLRYIPDEKLKLMWLNEEFPGSKRKNLICTYDDRNKVVDMWRREGIACFQVAPGDF